MAMVMGDVISDIYLNPLLLGGSMVDLFVLGVIGALFLILVCYLLAYYVFWQFWFLRDPQRAIPLGKKNIVSPADGKVINVSTYDFRKKPGTMVIRKGYIGKIMTLADDVGKNVQVITIFMNPLDVHVNRSPCDGKVLSSVPTAGKFFAASNLEKSLLNEKNEILIQTEFGKVKVIQIAGYVARRIESFVRKGQIVGKGQRIGLINLGSQVTLIMPADKVKPKVVIGTKVKAGESIIAEVL
jgi:phosphatidylserine decarboxylase